MNYTTTVKVSSRYQMAVPAAAREKLNIQACDRLIVDIQDGLMVILREPENYTQHLAGLHKEIWDDVDTNQYIAEERRAWEPSIS
jgi:AbrB family looped-hinge helix DNA binding protein